MALRCCRASAEQIKADTRAAELLKQDSHAFWKGVARDRSRKVTGFVNKIGDAMVRLISVKCGKSFF